jgi:hypothetical protein
LGVEDALSPPPTRDFLAEERGVMLVFRKDLAGVVLSGALGATLGAAPPLLVRAVRVLEELTVDEAVGATARRGVKGVVVFAAVRLVASVGFSGRGLLRSGRSMGILRSVCVLWVGGAVCAEDNHCPGVRQWLGCRALAVLTMCC